MISVLGDKRGKSWEKNGFVSFLFLFDPLSVAVGPAGLEGSHGSFEKWRCSVLMWLGGSHDTILEEVSTCRANVVSELIPESLNRRYTILKVSQVPTFPTFAGYRAWPHDVWFRQMIINIRRTRWTPPFFHVPCMALKLQEGIRRCTRN